VSLPTAAIAATWIINTTMLLLQPCSGRVTAPRGTRAVAAVQCRRAKRSRTVVAKAAMKALIFDCDGKMFDFLRRGQHSVKIQASSVPGCWLTRCQASCGTVACRHIITCSCALFYLVG
jgi:hypothetical protein